MALRATTQWFQHFLMQCDILLLQETHLAPEEENQLQLPAGYKCYALSRPQSAAGKHQGGGLLAIYCTTLHVLILTPLGETEVMLLRVDNLLIVNMYLPPPSSPWITHLGLIPEEHLCWVLIPLTGDPDHHLIVIGDFNACLGALAASLPRISPDTTVSTHGRALQHLCQDLAFHVLNSTAFHAAQSRMSYTSFQPGGSAVVDFVLASGSVVAESCALTLHVQSPWLSWSDYAPLVLSISTP
ncbi:hypothetical protein V8D89_014956, partial [Ganoderma adspersum]